MSRRRRPIGLRLIIAYKVAKAPVMLALAVWLSVAPTSALYIAQRLVFELSEGSATLARLAHWMSRYLTRHWATDVAVLAWIDGLSTAVEGALLWRGSAWGEWIVVVGLVILMPFEGLGIARHPSLTRLLVLFTNAVIVAYLIYGRIGARGLHSQESLRHEEPPVE
jgi:uncharacterized membrane protein (DUF2068 family)